MNKKIIIILTVAAVLLFFIIYEWGRNTSNNSTINLNQAQSTNTPNTQLPKSNINANSNTPTKTNKNTPIKTTTTVKLTYGEAVNTYKNRIQFIECDGMVNVPGIHTISVTKNTPIMLDNRDSIARTVVAQGQKMTLNAYDFKVFYPKTIGSTEITCDGRRSVTLNVN